MALEHESQPESGDQEPNITFCLRKFIDGAVASGDIPEEALEAVQKVQNMLKLLNESPQEQEDSQCPGPEYYASPTASVKLRVPIDSGKDTHVPADHSYYSR